MPRYIISSDTPITARALVRPGHGLPWPERPVDPGYGIEEDGEPGIGGGPILPSWPERPAHPWIPVLPSRDDLIDMLPPGLKPGPGHPIPPTPEHPWVPVDPAPEEPEVWPPPGVVWPPIRPELPGMPDLSGKTLVLALLFVSRHAPRWGYIVIDHDEAKSFLEKVKAWLKAHWPAGGAGGRPPARPTPG